MRQSIIFTNRELEIIKNRLNGNYSDKDGTYTNRIRPKLKEIKAWSMSPLNRRINNLLKQKRKTE